MPHRSAQRKRARTTEAEPELLQAFVLDIEEQQGDGAGIILYGCTPDRRSVMLTVKGFKQYFTVSTADDSGAITAAGLRSDVRVLFFPVQVEIDAQLAHIYCLHVRWSATCATGCRRP